MTKQQFAWLAGWLEGEGTFYSGAGNRTIIQAFSTDKDVIEKAARLVSASVHYIKPRPETTWNRLEGWRFHLGGERAAILMRRLLSHMGIRRSKQIRKTLKVWRDRPNRPKTKLCACGCGRKIFGGPRIIYAQRSGACAMRVWRKRHAA